MNTYCKVYVDSSLRPEEFGMLVSKLVGGTLQIRSVENQDMSVDIFQNKDAVRSEAYADFVTWPYYLDIEPFDEERVELPRYILAIRSLLEQLRTVGAQVVPACDFEEELK